MTREQFDAWKRIQSVLDGTAPSDEAAQTQPQQASGQQPAQAADAHISLMMTMTPAEIAKLPANMREDFRKAVTKAYLDWQQGKG